MGWHGRLRGWLFGVGVGALTLALAGPVVAKDLDKVTLRTNWLFYGSHAIFFLGIDRGTTPTRASTSWSSRATARECRPPGRQQGQRLCLRLARRP